VIDENFPEDDIYQKKKSRRSRHQTSHRHPRISS